jgi:hypothetical protein
MPHKEHQLRKVENRVLFFETGFYKHQYIRGVDCKELNAAITYRIYHLPTYKGIHRSTNI